MNKSFSYLLLLLATSGCTTNNYWQCRNPTTGAGTGAHPALPAKPAAALPPQPMTVPAPAPVPAAPASAAAPAAHSDSKYDRAPVAAGGHLMPPPAGATALSGEVDPLHFPHFCGPGARKHDAC